MNNKGVRLIIKGAVTDSQTHRGIGGLKVEAWDNSSILKAPFTTTTNLQGRFHFHISRSTLQKLFGGHEPALFFKVFSGDTLLAGEKEKILWHGRRKAQPLVIEVKRSPQGPNLPGVKLSVAEILPTIQGIPVALDSVVAECKKAGVNNLADLLGPKGKEAFNTLKLDNATQRNILASAKFALASNNLSLTKKLVSANIRSFSTLARMPLERIATLLGDVSDADMQTL